ncbi:LytTR family transcriptional regulator DNA-binding domain-containing protein [bacterium]|nr:LytTR family transcriptional regulator DNA-binding domain-containing protein [bacterium]
MEKIKTMRFLAIGLLAVLNLSFGFLFQVSRDLICYTELLVLVISSMVYWGLAIRPIDRIIRNIFSRDQWNVPQKVAALLIFSGIALVLNLMVAQASVFLIISYWLDIDTPAADILVATLTNNIAGNLLCFFSLAGITIYELFSSTSRPGGETEKPSFVMLSAGYAVTKVPFTDILYVQSNQNCITIQTHTDTFVKYQSLKSFLKECSYPAFKRIHRSFAVNEDYVSKIETNENGDGRVYLKNGSSVKLSRTFKKELQS